MEDIFSFTDIMGEDNTVEFKVIKTDADYRKFGICAKQYDKNGKLIDSANAEERFITETEATETIRMLCEYQVMPCTLCDIL